MHSRSLYLIAGVLGLVTALALPASAQLLELKVQESMLDNGLKVLMYEDHHSPFVACRLFYKAGSVNENPGNTGITHMLEHMLFKGTRKIGVRNWPLDSIQVQRIEDAYKQWEFLSKVRADSAKVAEALKTYRLLVSQEKSLIVKDELWDLYLQNGGTRLNAFTTDILTAYFVTLPKNKMELFFWLESDRMQNAVLREFYSERDVIAEERRLRYENRPAGRYWESLNAVFYEAHPYRNPTIGWMSDIQQLTPEALRLRLDTYYRPNNAILILAGDFQPDSVLALANRYFGRIPPSQTDPDSVSVKEPDQVGEKRLKVEKQASPRVDLLFHTPALGHYDLYPLDVVEGVLSGRNGRLYNRLVKKLKWCTDAGAGNGVQKFTSYFHVWASLAEDANPDSVERVMIEELEKLKKDTLSDYDLQRVKNNVTARTVDELKEIDEMANQLGFYEVMGDWRFVNEFPQRVLQVRREQVRDAARKYFVSQNRTVGVLALEDGARQ